MMAIINGKKLYNSRRLAALAKLNDRAAAEYSWMMAGTSDDWGRFEANARVIMGNAYKLRPGVTEADVHQWLKAFDRVRVPGEQFGLARFYEVDGVLFGEWTNYSGEAESQRRHHNCPEPPWSNHNHSSTCSCWRAARVTIRGIPKTYTSEPTVPTVPSVPSGTASTESSNPSGEPSQARDGLEVAAEIAEREVSNPSGEPSSHFDANRASMTRDGLEVAAEIAEREGLDISEVVRKASAYKHSTGVVNLNNLRIERLIHTLADLRAWKRRLNGTPEPEAKPAQDRRSVDAKNTDAIRQFIARRQADAGPTTGDRILEGVVTDHESVPAGGRRRDP